jgi:hypothetical protein
MLWSDAPVLRPRSEREAVALVRAIADAGCKVRPVGAQHSESGIGVGAAPLDDSAVGVSLSAFRAEPGSGWDGQLDRASGRVRVEAGRTLLHVHALARPAGWLLPTAPTNWAVTVGGALCGLVPGGALGRGVLGSAVTRVRALLADGSVREFDDAHDLAMWRNSMGLLGLALGVELQLERRPVFRMGVRSTVLHQWNPWYLDAAVAGLLPGAAAAHFLLDPWTDELAAVGNAYAPAPAPARSGLEAVFGGAGAGAQPPFSSDDDCAFDVASLSCSYPEFCHRQFALGDLTPAQSCRLRRRPDPAPHETNASYAELGAAMERAAAQGLPAPQSGSVHDWWGLDRLKAGAGALGAPWVLKLRAAVDAARERLNDGFWMMAAERQVTMSYLFPLHRLFHALDAHRDLVRALVIRNAQFQFRDSPLHFSFARMEPNQVLTPRAAFKGDYVCVEVRVSVPPPGAPGSHDWRFALAELERRWLALGAADAHTPAFPNPGGVYGFGARLDEPPPQQQQQQEQQQQQQQQQQLAGHLEALKQEYRRVRRVREAHERLRRHFEAYWGPPPRRRWLSWFGPEPPPSFEEFTGLYDPSAEMLAHMEQRFAAELDDERYAILLAAQPQVLAEVEAEDPLTGALERDQAGLKANTQGLPVPFTDSQAMAGLFSREQALAFLLYRQALDPENAFWGGAATHLFPKSLKTQVSGVADPDQLLEDIAVLRLHVAAAVADGDRNVLLNVAMLAAALLAVFKVAELLLACWRRRNSKRKRKHRRSNGSSDSSSFSGSSSSSSSSRSGGSGGSSDSDSNSSAST